MTGFTPGREEGTESGQRSDQSSLVSVIQYGEIILCLKLIILITGYTVESTSQINNYITPR